MSEIKEKKKRRGLWWKIPIGLFALFFVIGIIANLDSGKEGFDAGLNDSQNTASKDNKQVKQSTTTTIKKYGVGDPITVGEVKWIIGTPEVKDIIKGSNEFQESAKPNGVFVIIPVTAELTGKESGTIDTTQLKIVDSKGRKFEHTDNFNASVIYSDSSIFLKQVNPNVPIKGVAIFDIAKDSTNLKLEINDLRIIDQSDPGYVNLGNIK